MEFFVEVKEEGYYSFTFSSLLEHGNAWHFIEVQSPFGETVQYKLGHSMSMPLTDTFISLYQGVNRLRFTGDYGTIRLKRSVYLTDLFCWKLEYPGKRLTDTLLSCEVGSTLVQVWGGSDWHYVCYDDLSELVLQNMLSRLTY